MKINRIRIAVTLATTALVLFLGGCQSQDESGGSDRVDVRPVPSGSVTLSWNPPTSNGDGTVLNDLVAYKFYYGTEPGQYTHSIRIDNPGIARYVVENLVPDTYYFAATAINSLGIESRFSNEAVHQVL